MRSLPTTAMLVSAAVLGGGSLGPTDRAATVEPRPVPSLEDTVALGAFVNGVMEAHLDRLDLPAAAVVVVKGTRILYTRGYGYQDREAGTPIDPATSMFHIGSTGKLFTWTAVMQLVEQGKLDLDADVNTYLRTFQIPATFPEPITLRHLMTHTAGFQEGILGYFIGNDTTNIRSIEETVRSHVPTRVRPPGRLASYSNYGAALAGLIVEEVSGEPFAEYIERHVYQPLGIHYATFREPIPAALRPNAVVGYRKEDGVYVRQPFEIDGGLVPAGGTVMATLEMAKFMIAHLHAGRYGDRQILEPATAELMHRTAFAPDPRLPGVALGFIESSYNGHRVIGHDGDSQDFHVSMLLLPEDTVGIYLAYEGGDGIEAREGMARAFFDRYYPAQTPVPAPMAVPPATLATYAGRYRMIRMNYTDLDKLIYFLALGPVDVSALPSGRLLISGPVGSRHGPAQYVATGPGLFEEVDGHRRIAFDADSGTGVMRAYFDPTVDTEPVPWNESRSFWFPTLGLAFLTFLSVLVGTWYRRQAIRRMPPAERRAQWLAALTVGWLVLTLLAAVTVIAVYQMAILERIPPALDLVLAMPLGFVALSVALAVSAVRAWRSRYWTVGRRAHFTAVALAALALCWFFYQFNVLGWQFG
jgi:CubicO group peptidase (beta-lactamase class C family)